MSVTSPKFHNHVFYINFALTKVPRPKAPYQTQVKRGESQPTNIAFSSVVVHENFKNITISHAQYIYSVSIEKLEFPF